MAACQQCKKPIVGEAIKMDAGVTIGAGTPNATRLRTDVFLHDTGCYGAWMLHHYPWAVRTTTPCVGDASDPQ